MTSWKTENNKKLTQEELENFRKPTATGKT